MNQVDNLYDHYKDTYVLCKKAQEDRNKAFVVLCILEALLFMMIIRSEKSLSTKVCKFFISPCF